MGKMNIQYDQEKDVWYEYLNSYVKVVFHPLLSWSNHRFGPSIDVDTQIPVKIKEPTILEARALAIEALAAIFPAELFPDKWEVKRIPVKFTFWQRIKIFLFGGVYETHIIKRIDNAKR